MGRGFLLRNLAAVSAAAVLAGFASPAVSAAGNAGLHLHKTVDPNQLTINPNIGVTLAVDKTSAIPADTLTYTAAVTNPTATFAMGGDINAEAVADADATVAYYWDELEVCAIDCGNGMGNPNWKAVATFEATQSGYQPVTPPQVHSGMSLAAKSVTRGGVVYPTSGDPILGTVISPSATAAWTYMARVTVNPAQIAVLSDPAQVIAMRNVLHMEVTVRNSSAAQPYTDPELFTNPFTSAPNPGAITNVTVTFTLPDGSTVNRAATASLAPGGSASASTTYKIPVPAARGQSESEDAYVARLHGLDGSALSATAVASGGGFSGTLYATSGPATTNEFVPIVLIAKSGPASVDAGDTETNPLALQDVGGATASALTIVDTVPNSPNGAVSGTPASLAPKAIGSATATYPVPSSQAEGPLADTASVVWKDANGNSYGPLSSTFTTTVHNILFGADLSLAPVTAGPNPPGTAQTLTATLSDRHTNPIPNQVVTFTITGANAGSGTATTDATGKAVFTYTGNKPGNDTVIATVSSPAITLTSNTALISWGKPLQPVVTTQVQGNFYPNPNNACDFAPTGSPAFSQSFPDILFNADPSVVPHDISSVNPFSRPFNDLTVDVNGNYNGQIVAQGGGVQAGAGSMSNFYAVFTGSFVVTQAGDVTFTIIHDDGYILGVGNGATRVNGDLEGNPPATTPFQGYGVVAGWNQTGNTSGSDTVHFPAPGTYPYELDYTECGGGGLQLVMETAKFIAQTDPLSIYVGYADGLRPGGSIFPFPWQGSPGVTFVGGCTFDAGAIRFDNSGDTDITLDKVTVDLGAGGPHFDLWGPNPLTVPAHAILILTQTGCFNFDTSDFSNAGCGQNNGVLPLVNVTRGGVVKTYTDTGQVLNTHGFDMVCQGNESISWQRIAGQANTINVPLPPAVALDLMPFSIPNAVQGQSVTVTVSALDGAGNPQVNLPVGLHVTGTNAQNLTASTNASGLATFSYPGNLAGTDTLQATAFPGGVQALSNQGTVVWTSPGGTNNPLGATITNTSPAEGTVVTKPIAVDATIAPPAGQAITSWRVFYQAPGGPQVVIKSGSGSPPAPLGATFDPTVLPNGAYTLTVEATADNGAVQDVTTGILVFGALKLGRYTTTFQDMSVPVTGVQLEVQRTYDSLDANNSRDFGFGWHVSVSDFKVSSNRTLGLGNWTQYNQFCALGLCTTGFKNSGPRAVTVTWPDGHSDIYDFTPTGGTNVFWSCTPAFTARASVGTTGTLVALDDTGCSYIGDGNIYGAHGPYNPQQFQLTTRDGRVLVLDRTLGLVSMTDANGNRLTVDAAGIHASNGQSILFARDTSGRITTVTGPGTGQVVRYTYTSAGDLGTSVDPLGNTDTYDYDSAHHLLKVSGPQGAIGSTTYDASGRLASITDAAGHTTQIQTDVGAQTETFFDALRTSTTVTTADDLGDIIREDVISGGVTLTTTFVFDSAGHVVQKTDPLGHVTRAQYDSQGDLTRLTDGNGNTTQFTYDANGFATSVIAPDGSVLSSATYDANGNLTTLNQVGGGVVHFVYDGSGRLTSRTDASGNTVGYSYDSTGNLAGVTDPAGKSMSYAYDAANRPVVVTDPLGDSVQLRYDAAGNVTGIVDANGNTDTFTYDSTGNVTSATDPLGASATVTYDADSHVTSLKDRLGNTTTYTRDADGRLTRVDYPGGEFLAFTYDGFGRPITVTNSGSRIDNVYDAVGEVTSTTTTAPSIGAATITYTYDAAGNRISATGADGRVSYAYDVNGRLTSVTDPSGGTFGFRYDSASRVSSLSRPNGITDTYTYDSNGRLSAISSALGSSTVQSLSRTFDANGQVASTTNGAGTTNYVHDANGMLIGASGPGSAQTYAYDKAGNRVSGPSSAASSYNAADELTGDTNFTYTYDAQGQRTSKRDRLTGATTTYTYNGLGQLKSIQYPDGTSSTFAYDPLGRRIGITSGGVTTGFMYVGANPRLEYNGGSLAASYVTTGAIDRPLEMTRGTSSYYYLQDFQGSVTSLTTASGSVAASYSYDAFGVPTSAAPSVTNPFTYTGREYDAKGGLYYNRDRYYEPASGTFLTQDPVYTGHPYAYAANDPVDFSDPSGAGPTFDLGAIWKFIDSKFIQPLRSLACGLSAAAGVAEIMLNAFTNVSVTAESISSIALGVGVACKFASLAKSAGLSRAWTLLFLPIIAGIIAGIADVLFQIECIVRHGGQFSRSHVVWTAVSAAIIGIYTAVLGIPMEDNTSAAAVLAMVGDAGIGAGLAGWSDKLSPGSACG